MGFHIKQLENPDYLHLRITGKWDAETGPQMDDAIIEAFRNSSHNQAYLDMSTYIMETTIVSEFTQASYAADQLSDTRHQIAVLADKKYKETVEFFELAAKNRGANIRIFYNEKDAINWLNEAGSQ